MLFWFCVAIPQLRHRCCCRSYKPCLALMFKVGIYYDLLGYLKRKTALLHARRISYAYGISLHAFLTGQIGETTAQLKTGTFEEPVPDSIRPIKRKKNDHKDIKKRATALLKEGGKPSTLKAFAEKLDVSVGYLEYQLPELCRQVRMKRLAYLKEKRQAVLNSAKSSALNYFY